MSALGVQLVGDGTVVQWVQSENLVLVQQLSNGQVAASKALGSFQDRHDEFEAHTLHEGTIMTRRNGIQSVVQPFSELQENC